MFRTLIQFYAVKNGITAQFKMMQIFLQLYCGSELDFL